MDFIYALGGVSKAPGNLAVKFHNAAGDIEFTPASIRVDSKLHDQRHDLRGRLHVPAVPRHHGRAQADHPVAEHGALPRRPRLGRPVGVPGHGGVLGRPGRRLRRRGPAAEQAGLHLPAVRRHLAGLPERPGAARRDRRTGRGRRAHAPALHQADQRRGQGQARGHGHHHAHVPRQLPLLLGRLRRLRLRRRGLVLRAGRGRVLPGVRRRAVRRVRAAAVRAEGQDGRARPGHHQASRSWSPRTISSGGSTRRPSSFRWTRSACPASAGSPPRSRATR